MPNPTPFHPRTEPLCRSFLWKEWNGYASVRTFEDHTESEYYAIRHKVGIIDVSPLCKLDVVGPDAATLLSRVFTRDASRLAVRRVTYGLLVDGSGYVLDDGTLARIADDHFRLSTNDRFAGWLTRHARGLDVTIEDTTEGLAVLALQGPLARDLLAPLVDYDIGRMPFFRIRGSRIGDVAVEVSRTGYTGDLGYELWMDPADAVAVWDTLSAAGADLHLTPFGLDTLDVARIEAGFILAGVDYFGSRTAPITSRMSTPHGLGLGKCVDLDREVRFVGQDAVERELEAGPAWDLVGVELDSADLERLYHGYGLAPHFAPCVSRVPVPVYAEDGRTQVGQVTSQTWSPTLKRYLGLATVRASFGALDTPLRVEHTADYERRSVGATVVPRPFFDPPRRRSVTTKTQRNSS